MVTASVNDLLPRSSDKLIHPFVEDVNDTSADFVDDYSSNEGAVYPGDPGASGTATIY